MFRSFSHRAHHSHSPSLPCFSSSSSSSIFSSRRYFYFSWQSPDLKQVNDKATKAKTTAATKNRSSSTTTNKEKTYSTSQIWIPVEDLKWVIKDICPLKPNENPLRVRGLPVRLVLYNLSQLDHKKTRQELEEMLLSSSGGSESVVDSHCSFSTKQPYQPTMQFQLEQRAVISGFGQQQEQEQEETTMGDEKEKEEENKNNTSINNSVADDESRFPYEHKFWITPFESKKQNFRPHRCRSAQIEQQEENETTTSTKNNNLPSYEKPFAIIQKAQKALYNAAQFVEPVAFEKFPINFSTSRGVLPHQRSALQDWHNAHLEILESEEEKEKLYNKLAIFGTREEFEEMMIELKENASGVKVAAVFIPGQQKSEEEQKLEQERIELEKQEREEALKKKYDTSIPRDSDAFHYTDIIDQETLWKNSRTVSPDVESTMSSSRSSSSSSDTTENAETDKQSSEKSEEEEKQQQQKHILIPQDVFVFESMWKSLDERLLQNEQTKNNNKKENDVTTKKKLYPFWVSRKTIKTLGLNLKEGAKAVSSASGFGHRNNNDEKDNNNKNADSDFFSESNDEKQQKEREVEMIEYFHISQIKQQDSGLKFVGLHTR